MIQCLTPPTPPSHAQPYPADAESFVANPNPSLTAAVINASSIALLNASSVPMSGVLCAVAVGHSRSDDRAERGLVLDPENVQETCSRAGCFAFVFGEGTYGPDGELIWSDWSGAFESQEVCFSFSRPIQVYSTFFSDSICKLWQWLVVERNLYMTIFVQSLLAKRAWITMGWMQHNVLLGIMRSFPREHIAGTGRPLEAKRHGGFVGQSEASILSHRFCLALQASFPRRLPIRCLTE